MTPKQQLRSLEKKMERLQEWYPNFYLKGAIKHLDGIQRYYMLEMEYSKLKFEIEHCSQCGKKI